GWAILLRQKQKKLIMLPSETMIWQPEFTDKTLSRKIGAVQRVDERLPLEIPEGLPNFQAPITSDFDVDDWSNEDF
ncbi:hypothetical protein, partial [Escherichia coli]|uniref:hypothetical protein n=1 Tax=Escherichia coli TaxID=562 RepID=UPI001BB09BDB